MTCEGNAWARSLIASAHEPVTPLPGNDGAYDTAATTTWLSVLLSQLALSFRTCIHHYPSLKFRLWPSRRMYNESLAECVCLSFETSSSLLPALRHAACCPRKVRWTLVARDMGSLQSYIIASAFPGAMLPKQRLIANWSLESIVSTLMRNYGKSA